MRVCLDISQIAYRGGVATYTRNIANKMQGLDQIDLSMLYTSLRIPYNGSFKKVIKYPIPQSLNKFIFNKLHLIPIEILIGKVDIFHSSDWIQPPSLAKKVTTYHDVIPIKFPRWTTSEIVSNHKRRLELVEKEVDLVIAVSETTKKDLLEVSSIPESKIKVVYEGVDQSFHPLTVDEKKLFKEKYHLPQKFLLSIGGVGNRRNLERIKEACKGESLIISGADIYVPDSDFPYLLGSADVLVYPSLYEGFGLPIIEAFASGVPVVTSNLGAMSEIGKKAAVMVDPFSVESIKYGISEAKKDKDEWIKKGLIESKKFSWQNAAERTVDAYKTLLI